MSITIKQVAKRAGLSFQTVSKVLNSADGHLYRPETKERVFRAAAELGYRPNGFAQAVRSGRFGSVTLLLSTNAYRSTLPSALLDGIHDGIAPRDLNLSVARLPDEKLTNEAVVPRVLREWAADGMLVNYTDHVPPKMLDLIHGHLIPCVWINAKMASDCVHPDDFDAAYRATTAVVKRGHARVAYVQSIDWDSHYSTVDRTAGYERAMRDAGLQPIVWGNLHERHLSPTEVAAFDRDLPQVLRAKIEAFGITAIVAYGPTEGLAAARAAESIGRSVPNVFPVSVFAEEPLNVAGWALPTMVVPSRTVGRLAVESLFEKFDHPAVLQPTVAVPFQAIGI